MPFCISIRRMIITFRKFANTDAGKRPNAVQKYLLPAEQKRNFFRKVCLTAKLMLVPKPTADTYPVSMS